MASSGKHKSGCGLLHARCTRCHACRNASRVPARQ